MRHATIAALLSTVAFLLAPVACQAPPESRSQPSVRAGGGRGPVDATVASADGVAIHYRAEGDGEPALLFIHGWSCDGSYWDEQVPALAPRHRVVRIDLAGHGSSGTSRSDWTIEAFARDVQAVVEALDLKRAILIGHSMGGYVALEAARLMPERVIGLVPVDTLQDVDEKYDPKEIEEFLAQMEKDFRSTTLSFVRDMFLPSADPSLVERVASDMASSPPEVGIASIRSTIAHDPRPALAATGIPIRAIDSEKYPPKLEVNRRYAPQFEAVVMPGTGHFPMLERPAEFNRLLAETIAQLSAPAAAGEGEAE